MPPSILLADSNALSREAFGAFFRQEGWNFDVVTESDAVTSALGATEYDIIIVDVAMPDADGLRMLSEIVRDRPHQAIIALSQDTCFDEARKFFRLGATDILARPIDFSWLDLVVRQVIQERRQGARARQLYKFVTSERTEVRFTCRQLVEIDTVALPILDRLLAGSLMEQGAALRMKLAVQEAVVNALEHGNLELNSEWKEELQGNGRDRFSVVRQERLLDPDYANRTVTVQSWFDGRQLEITVKDQGRGFLDTVQDLTERSGIRGLACFGRGLALMFNSVDEVTFDRNGSEVTLRKFITRPKGG